MTVNPIKVGSEWEQGFSFPEGFFLAGDAVRCELRRYANEGVGRLDDDEEAIVPLEPGAGTAIVGDTLQLTLTPEQTVMLKLPKVVTNFVVLRGGREIPIGQIVTIPVVVLPTRPRR